VLSVIAIIATVAITGIALTAYAAYRNVYDSIHHVDVTNAMLGKRPPKLNGALNILVIGSDSRARLHGFGRGIAGSRSDTSMLLHISPTHSHAFVISFPRDSMVPIFGCEADGHGHPGQHAQPGGLERLNVTFSDGGPACLWKTLEQTTHVHIDHFVEVNFTGFQKIVNDVGGVEVCLPFAIRDPASKLNLSRGRHLIGGAQALAFVRERHIGLGSDLQRIQRQQYFLAAVAQKIKNSGILSDPPKLYTLVHDIASSLTTDTGLTVTGLYSIADALKNLSTNALRFISVPVVAYPPDPGAEVQWAQPAASQLFLAIAKDNKIQKAADKAATAASAAAKTARPAPTVSPSQVQLEVLNGTNVAGLAARTAGTLSAHGFRVTATGNATTATYTASVIEYGAASQLPDVNTLKNEVPGAQVQQVPGLPAGSLALVLGSSFNGLASAAHMHPPRVATLGNGYGGISGSANICKDSGAFAGPDTPSMFSG
jgi:LCP family protein required for cell wall assembly